MALLPFMAEFASQQATEHDRVAVVMDVREPRFIARLPVGLSIAAQGAGPGADADLPRGEPCRAGAALLGDAAAASAGADRPVTEGLAEERASLRPIKAMADKVVDTTSMNVHELRQVFLNVVAGRRQASTLVLDVPQLRLPLRRAGRGRPGLRRALPEESALGPDLATADRHAIAPCSSYMRRQPLTGQFLRRLKAFLRFLLPQYVDEGKAYLTVAIGCTGGRHRSVFVAERSSASWRT